MTLFHALGITIEQDTPLNLDPGFDSKANIQHVKPATLRRTLNAMAMTRSISSVLLSFSNSSRVCRMAQIYIFDYYRP